MEAPIVDLPLPIAAGDLVIPAVSVAPKLPYTVEKVSWTKRDALLFNASIGCKADELHFLYENHPRFSTFPTLPLGLNFKFAHQEVIDFYASQKELCVPGMPVLDPSRLVDGQRKIEIIKQVPVTSAGRDFEFRATLLGAFDKGKAGTVIKMQDDLVDARSGELYARITGSLFYIGQGGWGGPRGQPEPSFSPPSDRSPDLMVTLTIGAQAAHLYRLNGDYNPLHADPAVGEALGYGGIILHGVYAYSCVAHELLRVIGGSDPANFREFHARFAGPVRPSDNIIVEVWSMYRDAEGWEELRWRATVVQTGRACLTDGRALIRRAPVQQPRHLQGKL